VIDDKDCHLSLPMEDISWDDVPSRQHEAKCVSNRPRLKLTDSWRKKQLHRHSLGPFSYHVHMQSIFGKIFRCKLRAASEIERQERKPDLEALEVEFQELLQHLPQDLKVLSDAQESADHVWYARMHFHLLYYNCVVLLNTPSHLDFEDISWAESPRFVKATCAANMVTKLMQTLSTAKNTYSKPSALSSLSLFRAGVIHFINYRRAKDPQEQQSYGGRLFNSLNGLESMIQAWPLAAPYYVGLKSLVSRWARPEKRLLESNMYFSR
jgi:hypothetical protein